MSIIKISIAFIIVFILTGMLGVGIYFNAFNIKTSIFSFSQSMNFFLLVTPTVSTFEDANKIIVDKCKPTYTSMSDLDTINKLNLTLMQKLEKDVTFDSLRNIYALPSDKLNARFQIQLSDNPEPVCLVAEISDGESHASMSYFGKDGKVYSINIIKTN